MNKESKEAFWKRVSGLSEEEIGRELLKKRLKRQHEKKKRNWLKAVAGILHHLRIHTWNSVDQVVSRSVFYKTPEMEACKCLVCGKWITRHKPQFLFILLASIVVSSFIGFTVFITIRAPLFLLLQLVAIWLFAKFQWESIDFKKEVYNGER